MRRKTVVLKEERSAKIRADHVQRTLAHSVWPFADLNTHMEYAYISGALHGMRWARGEKIEKPSTYYPKPAREE